MLATQFKLCPVSSRHNGRGTGGTSKAQHKKLERAQVEKDGFDGVGALDPDLADGVTLALQPASQQADLGRAARPIGALDDDEFTRQWSPFEFRELAAVKVGLVGGVGHRRDLEVGGVLDFLVGLEHEVER